MWGLLWPSPFWSCWGLTTEIVDFAVELSGIDGAVLGPVDSHARVDQIRSGVLKLNPLAVGRQR